MISQNSLSITTDSLQNTPHTATTLVSTINPFQFPTPAPQHGYPPHPCLQQSMKVSGSAPWLNCSQTMPGHTHQTQPIPKTHSLPSHAHPIVGVVTDPRLFHQTASVAEEDLEECDVMFENPLNAQYEEEKVSGTMYMGKQIHSVEICVSIESTCRCTCS